MEPRELVPDNQPENRYDQDWVFLIKDIKVREKYQKEISADPIKTPEAPQKDTATRMTAAMLFLRRIANNDNFDL